MRVAPIGVSVPKKVQQRRHRRVGIVWLLSGIMDRIEQWMRLTSLFLAKHDKMVQRIKSIPDDVGIAPQIVERIEQRIGLSPLFCSAGQEIPYRIRRRPALKVIRRQLARRTQETGLAYDP